MRKGFYAEEESEREKDRDLMWYIWQGQDSPLFGKDKMATFERYFLKEKETHAEKKNPTTVIWKIPGGHRYPEGIWP